jgi:hypothetical protein
MEANTKIKTNHLLLIMQKSSKDIFTKCFLFAKKHKYCVNSNYEENNSNADEELDDDYNAKVREIIEDKQQALVAASMKSKHMAPDYLLNKRCWNVKTQTTNQDTKFLLQLFATMHKKVLMMSSKGIHTIILP